jgi:hypothetical protein
MAGQVQELAESWDRPADAVADDDEVDLEDADIELDEEYEPA